MMLRETNTPSAGELRLSSWAEDAFICNLENDFSVFNDNNKPIGSVLGSFGAFQGNIWSVAPFIPVGPGENGSKIEKWAFFTRPSVKYFKNAMK